MMVCCKMQCVRLLLACLVKDVIASLKIELTYAVSLLPPVTGKYFSGEVSTNELLCFGNLDYQEDTYVESFLCMLQWRYDSDLPSKSCFGLWGTRHVVVEVDGSVEFMRMGKLPRESGETDKTYLEAAHWLYLSNSFENKPARETIRVNAEPIYICARSNLWGVENTTSSFNLQFRNAYMRYTDRKFSLQQTFMQSIIAFGMSFPIISPIIGSLSAARIFYIYGLNYFIAIFSMCIFFLLSSPVIFTSKSRQTTRAAFHRLYFSTGEVDEIAQKPWLLYQSFYLSSLIVCGGSIFSYGMFSILGIERELRNDIIRVSLGVSAASFFYFFIAKLFPVFSRQYMWVFFAFFPTVTMIRESINKESQNEVLLSIYAILIVSNILYHKILQVTFIARVRRDLVHALMTSLFGFSIAANDNDTLDGTALMAPMDCQLQLRDLNPSNEHAEETMEHTIVYDFFSNTIANDHLERIAVLSEAFFCSKSALGYVICKDCQQYPQLRFLSLKTEVDGCHITLRVRHTRSRSRSCDCDDKKPPTVFGFIAIIKNELSISPNNISLESLLSTS